MDKRWINGLSCFCIRTGVGRFTHFVQSIGALLLFVSFQLDADASCVRWMNGTVFPALEAYSITVTNMVMSSCCFFICILFRFKGRERGVPLLALGDSVSTHWFSLLADKKLWLRIMNGEWHAAAVVVMRILLFRWWVWTPRKRIDN